MNELNIVLDPASPLSLQQQLRYRIVHAIHNGVLRPGRRLPSSRALSRRLQISRNTVSLAYDALIAEGHLASRERSGIYVAAQLPRGRIASGQGASQPESALATRLPALAEESGFRCPANWHQFPFPFIDGRVDETLLPVAEWREAMRLASASHEAACWNHGNGDGDDAMLLDEIRGKVLPGRGIIADIDQLLIANSTRHALYLVATLLVRRGTPVLLEEPVDAALEHYLRQRHGDVSYCELGRELALPAGAIVFTSARRTFEANSELPQWLLRAATAADAVVVDHDSPLTPPEGNRIAPALRAIDAEGRVIHVGGMARAVSAGEPPAAIVTVPAVIERLRKLRRNQGAAPAWLMQRAWAYFIGLGHYEAALAGVGRVLQRRQLALRDAVNHYLHDCAWIQTLPGSSAYWLRMKDGSDMPGIARRAAAAGVLVEPASLGNGQPTLCMGITSLPESRIREGVRVLSRLLRGGPGPAPQRLGADPVAPLRARALQGAMKGLRLLYNTVYGEPCTLELHPDGSMSGIAGVNGEDCDRGRWWVEGDHWFRQWQQWAYGEAAGFSVVIDGDQLRWYGEDGLLVDTAVILRADRRTPRRRPG